MEKIEPTIGKVGVFREVEHELGYMIPRSKTYQRLAAEIRKLADNTTLPKNRIRLMEISDRFFALHKEIENLKQIILKDREG